MWSQVQVNIRCPPPPRVKLHPDLHGLIDGYPHHHQTFDISHAQVLQKQTETMAQQQELLAQLQKEHSRFWTCASERWSKDAEALSRRGMEMHRTHTEELCKALQKAGLTLTVDTIFSAAQDGVGSPRPDGKEYAVGDAVSSEGSGSKQSSAVSEESPRGMGSNPQLLEPERAVKRDDEVRSAPNRQPLYLAALSFFCLAPAAPLRHLLRCWVCRHRGRLLANLHRLTPNRHQLAASPETTRTGGNFLSLLSTLGSSRSTRRGWVGFWALCSAVLCIAGMTPWRPPPLSPVPLYQPLTLADSLIRSADTLGLGQLLFLP